MSDIFPTIVAKVLLSAKRNAPTILTGLGILGYTTAIALAIKATPSAFYAVEDLKYEKTDSGSEPPTPLEIVKVTWKFYIPTMVTFATSTTCVIAANMVHLDREAALLAVYGISQTAFSDYRDKVKELLGAKKEQQVKDALTDDELKKNPPTQNNIIITKTGTTLCYDAYSGRYFLSDIERLRQIQNNFNHALMTEMFISLNDLYHEMGLPPIELGRHVGWQIERGLLDFEFSAKITETKEPCIVVGHHIEPDIDA